MNKTDNKQVLSQGKAACNMQNQILEAVEQAVIVTDMNGLIQYWNRAAEQLYGWPETEVLGRSVFEILPTPLSAGEEAANVFALLQRGEKWSTECRVQRRDGECVWTYVTDSLLQDELGQFSRVVKVATDITERKRVEVQLVEQAETIATINRIGQMLSAELELHKLVQLVTDAATDLTGAQFGAFFYNTINEGGDVYQLYTLSGAPQEAFANFPLPRSTHVFGPTFRNEGVIRSGNIRNDPRYGHNAPHHGMPQGHLPVSSYLAVPVVSRSGEVLGGLFFGHGEPDVFSERIEQIIVGIAAQTAIAMDNARLYEQARRAIHVRDQFLSLAAHELKTPLTSIVGQIELFQRRNEREHMLNPRDQRTLGTIASQVRRLSHMVMTLLDISRIETGQLNIERQPVDVVDLVNRIVAEVQLTIGKRQIQVEHAAESLIIHGDELRLEQVIQNLLQNALKYSGSSDHVFVSVMRQNDQIQVAVRDTGIGIPQSALPQLFVQFYRAGNVDHDKISGLGIGLYVVKEIVELHGGTVHVDSIEGVGSTFTIALPVAKL